MSPTFTRVLRVALLASLGAVSLLACADDVAPPEARPSISLGDGGFIEEGDMDRSKHLVDGGYAGADGGVVRADRFITTVVSFTPGPCAGFGASEMPSIVFGPPVGRGATKGSLDVVALGVGGEIVLSFEPNAILDGPGPDFIVFENAFYAAGDATQPAADLGEVSVSEDGVTWATYTCAPGPTAPYGACAGWNPVYSAPGNGISPFDPATAGGEAYDLADLGMTRARFVRIKDRSEAACEGQPKPTTNGFDLDAIALIHADLR